jgi:hypothetical protein
MQLIPKARLSAGLVLLAGSLLQFSVPGSASPQDAAGMELTLQQAIDLALRQNRNVKLAQLGVVENEQKKRSLIPTIFRTSRTSPALSISPR